MACFFAVARRSSGLTFLMMAVAQAKVRAVMVAEYWALYVSFIRHCKL